MWFVIQIAEIPSTTQLLKVQETKSWKSIPDLKQLN